MLCDMSYTGNTRIIMSTAVTRIHACLFLCGAACVHYQATIFCHYHAIVSSIQGQLPFLGCFWAETLKLRCLAAETFLFFQVQEASAAKAADLKAKLQTAAQALQATEQRMSQQQQLVQQLQSKLQVCA